MGLLDKENKNNKSKAFSRKQRVVHRKLAISHLKIVTQARQLAL